MDVQWMLRLVNGLDIRDILRVLNTFINRDVHVVVLDRVNNTLLDYIV